jgi:uncharacterized membrane protein YGL010W
MVFVPVIFWSAMIFLDVPLASLGVPVPITAELPSCVRVNVALLTTAAYVLYYLSMTRTVGALASALVVGLYLGANSFIAATGADAWKYAVVAHIIAWAAQFYAHDVYEGVWWCHRRRRRRRRRRRLRRAGRSVASRVVFANDASGYAGRKPALFDSLFQSLFMAPLFITVEALINLGFMKEFHKRVQPRVAEYRKLGNPARKQA